MNTSTKRTAPIGRPRRPVEFSNVPLRSGSRRTIHGFRGDDSFGVMVTIWSPEGVRGTRMIIFAADAALARRAIEATRTVGAGERRNIGEIACPNGLSLALFVREGALYLGRRSDTRYIGTTTLLAGEELAAFEQALTWLEAQPC